MLYNKYRPSSFKDVMGQPSVAVLRNSIELDRIPHSILMFGTRGVGKTSLARVYARAINCTGNDPTDKPCGKCKSCKRLDHPDIYEMDSTVHGTPSGIITLQQRVSLIPEFKKKVFILDEAHSITKKGLDILLKTVEEPSSKAVIIMLTTEPEKLGKTLRSRCMQLSLSQLSKEALVKLLAKVCKGENIKASRPALYKLAHYAQGSPRDALSLLETVRNYEEVTGGLIDKVIGHRIDADEFLEKLASDTPADAMKILINLCYQYEPKFIAESIIAGLLESVKRLMVEDGSKAEIRRRLKWAEMFRRAKEDTGRTFMPQLGLELVVAEIALLGDEVLLAGNKPSDQSAVVYKPTLENIHEHWKTFLGFVDKKNKSISKQAENLKYVRIKGGKSVVVKTTSPNYDEESTPKLETLLKEFLTNNDIRLEVL